TNGTATAGLDYAPVGSVLFFPAGITNASFAIAITNDTLDELSETIGLVLFNPTNATLGALREATLTIVDDDPPTARFSSASFTASETPANTVVNISVVLSKPPAQTVFVDWSVGGGSASPGADYFSTGTGTLTFGPGQTNKTFQLTLFTDTQTEGDETVEMRLIDFSGATRGTPDHAVLTILDDDSPPRILETTRPANDTFTMTLSGAVGQRFALELSTNLPLWRVYRVLTNHTGVLQFTDTFTPAAGVRFYRTAYPAP
ncbi:MAG TPA: Calx-beta domain-containing protein, partial [Methylomirabilota bacterium]|nr:Calx-beta domain-containing protein [Methylomirabilota bacterium]